MESFVEGYEWTESEALGLILATYFEWTGEPILETAAAALEDANFHSEAQLVRDMLDRLKAGRFKKEGNNG